MLIVVIIIAQYGKITWSTKPEARSGVVSSVFTYHGCTTSLSAIDSIIFSFSGSTRAAREQIITNIKTWNGAPGVTSDDTQVITLGFDWSADYHEYSIEWTPRHVSWIVDGTVSWT